MTDEPPFNDPRPSAERAGCAENPTKVCLVRHGVAESEGPCLTLALLTELTDYEVTVGHKPGPDDILRTRFSRQDGKPLDEGKLAGYYIPRSELDRIEEFEIQGAYVALAQK